MGHKVDAFIEWFAGWFIRIILIILIFIMFYSITMLIKTSISPAAELSLIHGQRGSVINEPVPRNLHLITAFDLKLDILDNHSLILTRIDLPQSPRHGLWALGLQYTTSGKFFIYKRASFAWLDTKARDAETQWQFLLGAGLGYRQENTFVALEALHTSNGAGTIFNKWLARGNIPYGFYGLRVGFKF